MTQKVILVVVAMLVFAVGGCNDNDNLSSSNFDDINSSTDSHNAGLSKYTPELISIAKDINEGRIPPEDISEDISPIEKGMIFDIISVINGDGDDFSAESLESMSMEYFGLPFSELDAVSKDFIFSEVVGYDDDSATISQKSLRSWILKKVQKALGRGAAKKLGTYMRDCEIPSGFFWRIVDKVPVVGWALVPCIAR